MSKFAEIEEKQNNYEGATRGAKFQRTGTSGRRAASADGRMPRKQVVLLGFPKELRQPTLQRTAESVRHTIGHSGAAPKIKVMLVLSTGGKFCGTCRGAGVALHVPYIKGTGLTEGKGPHSY